MDVRFNYKVKTIDFYLIILALLFSLCSHLLASKIIILNIHRYSIPLMASSFTYTLILTMGNLVRTYSTRLNAIRFILVEMLFILFFVLIMSFFLLAPSPYWSTNNLSSITIVLSLVFAIYKSNFTGVLFSYIIEIFLYSFLSKHLLPKLGAYSSFIVCNIFASFIILSIYVYITDFLFLKPLYPKYWLTITNFNLLSNALMIIIYSFIWAIVLKLICILGIRYLPRPL